MNVHPHTATVDEPLHKVVEENLEQANVEGMPVVRDERIVGMLSRSDLVRILASGSAENVVSLDPNDDAIRERLMAERFVRCRGTCAYVRSTRRWKKESSRCTVGSGPRSSVAHSTSWRNTSGVSEVHDHAGHRARFATI